MIKTVLAALFMIGFWAPFQARAAASDGAALKSMPAVSLLRYAQAGVTQAQSQAAGRVVALRGGPTATRGGTTAALKAADPIFKGDVLQSRAGGSLAVTFTDGTTLTLSSEAEVEVTDFLYEDGGNANKALFEFARGAIGFAASKVAKTGDMKIATPVATMGVRGTTGIVDVPAAGGETKVKLYPDANGAVGRIEIFAPDGPQLGVLSQGRTAYAIGPDGFSLQSGRPRYRARSVRLSARETTSDTALVRQLHAAQTAGQRLLNRGGR